MQGFFIGQENLPPKFEPLGSHTGDGEPTPCLFAEIDGLGGNLW
jgi:hypothetical protein